MSRSQRSRLEVDFYDVSEYVDLSNSIIWNKHSTPFNRGVKPGYLDHESGHNVKRRLWIHGSNGRHGRRGSSSCTGDFKKQADMGAFASVLSHMFAAS